MAGKSGDMLDMLEMLVRPGGLVRTGGRFLACDWSDGSSDGREGGSVLVVGLPTVDLVSCWSGGSICFLECPILHLVLGGGPGVAAVHGPHALFLE